MAAFCSGVYCTFSVLFSFVVINRPSLASMVTGKVSATETAGNVFTFLISFSAAFAVKNDVVPNINAEANMIVFMFDGFKLYYFSFCVLMLQR